jgi:hypothetical protein
MDLLDVDWDKTIEIEKYDANLSFNKFYAAMELIIDKHLPLKKLTHKQYKRKFKPWITNGILTSSKIRDKLYSKYTKSKDPVIKKEILIEYKKLRNFIVNLTRRSKENYYKKYFEKNNNNLRMIWKGLKEIVNIKSKSDSSPNCIEEENGIITDPAIISNKFNDYFSDIASNILKERKFDGIKQYHQFMGSSSEKTLFFKPTDKDEIAFIISLFKRGKASGPTSIPYDIIQLTKLIISEPLAKIANLSFETGIHPELLKIQKVVPIFKKGSKLKTANYRPISLLSNINKIFEKIVFERVYDFIQDTNQFYNYQYGFRKRHSTGHALINITEQIRMALDHNQIACGIFVDFQKAFDTVNHEILINKLHHYGIRGNICDWFSSYCKNRKQFVSILGFESEKRTIMHGVPQGSVLGPLLFLLYINDLHKSIYFSTTYHFADDTNLLLIGKNAKEIQKKMNKDLKGLYSWLLANKISLNVAKTELIIFKKVHNPPPLLKIKLNGKKNFPSQSVKYLGVYLDSSLSGKTHCDNLLTKLRRANGLLAKIRHHISPHHNLHNTSLDSSLFSLDELGSLNIPIVNNKTLISLYYAVFNSILTYGCQVWGSLGNPSFQKVIRLQKEALRIITFSNYGEHTSPIFKELKILKFEDHIKLQNLLFVHDFINKKLPSSFDDFFITKNNKNVKTRGDTIGLIKATPYNQIKYGRKSITHTSVITWNKFSNNFFKGKSLSTLSRNQFKKLISNFFIEQY